MLTLAQACRPRDSIFDKTRRDTVLDLTDLVEGRIDADAFFAENYTTEGMRILLTEVFRRLEGKSTQGVFKLTQAMGGGKTHNLLAAGLLADRPALRAPVMGDFYTPGDIGRVRVVAFTGRESDTPFGIWGAIAEQLGKREQFADYYSPLAAPGQTAWVELLKGEPLLIMLDELPPYTESALKAGNYVQGTVLMVLRKRLGEETAFLDELVPEVETEVQEQLGSMLELDDQDDPNFTDADYQLAAYAAALRVLTGYANIEDLDVAYELARERVAKDKSPIVGIIEDAVKTASNYLVPAGLDKQLWRRMTPEERLYLKCLEVESHGDYRSGVFQEFARGLGVRDYRYMLHSGRANQTRLNTASEFQRREWGGEGFGASLLRHCLYAVYQTAAEDDPNKGRTYLKTELAADYWPQRQNLIALADYLSKLPMAHWQADAEAARLLAGLLRQDSV